MKEKPELRHFVLKGILWTCIYGTIVHFTFAFFATTPILKAFIPINGSVWEQLKLLFWPILLYSCMIWILHGNLYVKFFYALAKGVSWGSIAIVVGVFTYSGILGSTYSIINLLVFYCGVVIAFVKMYVTIQEAEKNAGEVEKTNRKELMGIVLIGIILLCFLVFTFFPPHLGMFL